MKFCLMWANHDATCLWDKRNSSLHEVIRKGSVPREEFDRICDRVISRASAFFRQLPLLPSAPVQVRAASMVSKTAHSRPAIVFMPRSPG